MHPKSNLASIILPEGGTGPLFLRVHNALRDAVTKGAIAPGDRLPSSRALAADLGLSRATIVSAYDQLVAEGYAETRPGAGIFACDAGPIAGVRQAVGPNKIAHPDIPVGRVRAPLPLTPGISDLSLFPARAWAQSLSRVARREPEALHNCQDSFGDWQLRQQIVRHLFDWRGVHAHPEQVVITGGSGEALERALELTQSQGPGVGLENPGYPPMRKFAQSRGWPIRWLDVDQEGAVPPGPGGAIHPGAVVLTPSHQFPLGGAMSQTRRARFATWAEQTGAWIIEDDFDSEFRYAGRPIPALATLGGSDRVIYVGSFSKVFSHGIRLGFMVLPDALVDPARTLLRHEPTRASVLGQRPLARFMEDGSYLRHLGRARRVYGRRYGALLRALDATLAGIARYHRHNAGMLLACHLPPTLPDKKLAKATRDMGLGCVALSDYGSANDTTNGLLLGFCATPDTQIAGAVHKVALAVQD